MDQELLVKAGRAILAGLDAARIPYKLAMWTYKPEIGSWKFWILPERKHDQRDFYRQLAGVVTTHRDEMGGIDISDVEMITEQHPVVRAMRGAFRVEGGGVIRASNNVLNGFYLPDAIIMKMVL